MLGENEAVEKLQTIEDTTGAYDDIEFVKRIKKIITNRCLKFIEGPKVLSLGYTKADCWAETINKMGYSLDIVEGASTHVEYARQKFAGIDKIRISHELFESYKPVYKYNTVIAGSVIELNPDPNTLLKCIKGWLEPNGRFLLTTPNRRSLHRRVGAYMNIESSPDELNEPAFQTSTVHLYDRYELRSVLQSAGFQVEYLSGYFLKPLSNRQMETWSDELLMAFLMVGEELGDYCKELVAVCKKSQTDFQD